MKSLKVAIFAQLESPTINQQLAPLMRERGHTVDVIDLSQLTAEPLAQQPLIQSLTAYDLVYYRSGLETDINPARIIELEAFLTEQHIKTINLHYTSHPEANSKIYETRTAEAHGLLTPKSLYETNTPFSTIATELGTPFIAKTNFGTHGDGVYMIQSEAELLTIQTKHPDKEFLYQTFIPHDFEYRVHIMGGEAVCIWKKAPPIGDFRSNEAQGGAMMTAEAQYIPKLIELAQKTFAVFTFEIFVADFMLDKNTNTFYFTEINLNPGWGESDRIASGIDVIGLTADYFEAMAQ